MSALAATVEHGEHAAAFYATPEFWVFAAFVILLALVIKPVYRMVAAALDDRAKTIRTRIEEATELAEQARELLASYQRKRRDAIRETEEIVGEARRETDRMAERARANLERALERREQLAIERIAQAEATALDEVRTAAVDAALEATHRLLLDKVRGEKAEALVDEAIKELPEKLN